MRILLMISNSNMAIRELYTVVLNERYPGWGISNMSGLPPEPAGIIGAFDAVVYELGAPDDPRRYRGALDLWDSVKDKGRPRIITHIEGPFREGVVAELESNGVICVGAPFTPQAIGEALRRVAPQPAPAPSSAREDTGAGLAERLRGLFRRRG